MNILAIADRPPQESIIALINRHAIDIVVTLGDLEQFSLIELERVTLPKLGVYGNHCSGTYFEKLGIQNLHMATISIHGYTFGGFEGCVRYKESEYDKMYTQEETSALMKGFPYVDIFLTHCPPYGINDEPNTLAHQGYKALKDYVEVIKPKYLFHGHTYPTETNKVTHYLDTKILYIHQAQVITI